MIDGEATASALVAGGGDPGRWPSVARLHLVRRRGDPPGSQHRLDHRDRGDRDPALAVVPPGLGPPMEDAARRVRPRRRGRGPRGRALPHRRGERRSRAGPRLPLVGPPGLRGHVAAPGRTRPGPSRPRRHAAVAGPSPAAGATARLSGRGASLVGVHAGDRRCAGLRLAPPTTRSSSAPRAMASCPVRASLATGRPGPRGCCGASPSAPVGRPSRWRVAWPSPRSSTATTSRSWPTTPRAADGSGAIRTARVTTP